jgi:hypothetical protein
MNEQNEIDRRVAAWLEDGPSRAPDRSIEPALAHARAHPRRRDPLAFIRKDPMNAQTSPIQAAFRPLALVAVLALVLVAAFAVAAVGGFFDGRSIVVPPVATPSPTAIASPLATPVPSALVATPSPSVLHVDLIEHVGADASVDITDLSGTLVSAVSGDPGDGGSVPDGAVQAASPVGDPASVVLTWTGTPCDTTHTLTIAPDGVTIAITRPACQGDALPVDHVLKLTFDHPVEFTRVNPTIQTIQP